MIEGDARYLAPELLNEGIEFKDLYKADIFSLGATIYEMMIGKTLPCNGEEWHMIRQGKLEENEVFSDNLRILIKSLLSDNPQNRPSAEEILSHDIF